MLPALTTARRLTLMGLITVSTQLDGLESLPPEFKEAEVRKAIDKLSQAHTLIAEAGKIIETL